ncbi:hypothetical protein BSPP4475_16485 [Brevibacillus aydinogluensis]|jgi:hypothetical protein|uniref:Uncharacterized protein n=1 Tax=Brevibacillus aydinogluensis TaxID=927786 RepID=A0AA48RIM7_9BACL|nr:hypothetical protein BSPP4475_16485 [Brevibacillus aydinogluensis]
MIKLEISNQELHLIINALECLDSEFGLNETEEVFLIKLKSFLYELK